MPRIRYLKPCFFKDEDIAELPHYARLMYQGLWVLADRKGRLEDRPKRIKAEIFPYESVDIEKGLTLLASTKSSGRPFINRYEKDGERYIQILKWEDHQKPHHTEKESIIPPAPPLKDKENGDGEDKLARSESEVKQRTSNRSLTVKEKTPNTIEEVRSYFLEISCPLEAEAFFDHFSSNGWKVGGKTPMADWKAAARRWKERSKTFTSTTQKKTSDLDAILEKKRKETENAKFYA